ncbi:TRAP transporter small permease [Enterovirga sp. CN4-39]|uniref:TRAP transporter small permease n=1 Tax=Enterovirga sp. CN4-39 TaxID=3400910 RepID=UPI003C0B652E
MTAPATGVSAPRLPAAAGGSTLWRLLAGIGRVRDVAERVLAGTLIFLAVALMTVEILLRNVFGTSIVGVEQIGVFLIAWSVFLGAAFGVARNIHVRVDVLQMMMPRPIRLVCEIVGWSGALIFSLALAWSGYKLVEETQMLGDTTVGLMRIPMWIPQMIMPIAGVLISLRIIERLVLTIRRRETVAADPNELSF